MSEALDKYFDNELNPENPKDMRATDLRLASLEQDARQPRLAAEVDVRTDTKTRKRSEEAAADQAEHWDSCSAKKVDAGPPMCLTSFDDDSTEPSALPCRDDTMVDKDAAAPKPCLLPVKFTHQQPPVTYFPPAQPLQQRGSSFPDLFLLRPSVKRPRKEPAGQTTTSLPLPTRWRKVIQMKPRL